MADKYETHTAHSTDECNALLEEGWKLCGFERKEDVTEIGHCFDFFLQRLPAIQKGNYP
jgi:hypothetical protein